MNALQIIDKYYTPQTELYKILIKHSQAVTQKALSICSAHPELKINSEFVAEAAMLHDIGIFQTNAPKIHCLGEHPYITHGYLGHDLLIKEGYPLHALVCERHTGAGLTLDEIINQKLPIPHRDMTPLSIEEQVICFSDCFFSKTHLDEEKTIDQITKSLSKYGERSVNQFRQWCNLFL